MAALTAAWAFLKTGWGKVAGGVAITVTAILLFVFWLSGVKRESRLEGARDERDVHREIGNDVRRQMDSAPRLGGADDLKQRMRDGDF